MQPLHAEFDGYALRSVSEAQDRPVLQSWIEADRFHREVMRPEFFLGMRQDSSGQWVIDRRPNCYALEDLHGTIMYIRLSRAARVHIQFMPTIRHFEQRTRTAAALVHGMRFLEFGLARAGAEEWIFSTESASLTGLAKGRLGFEASLHELVKGIPYLDPRQRQEEVSRPQEEGA